MSHNHAVINILMALNSEFSAITEEELINSEEHQEHGYKIIDCPICKNKTLEQHSNIYLLTINQRGEQQIYS